MANRYIFIKDGVVENIVVGEPGPEGDAFRAQFADHVILSDGSFAEPNIGDAWNGGTSFSPRVPTAAEIAAANIAAGFDVTPEGFILPLDANSVATWTALKGQLRDGLDLGAFQPTDNSPYPIIDADGISHILTVQRLRAVLFAGGNYYAIQLATIAAG